MALPLLTALVPTIIDMIPEAIGWFAGNKAEKATDDVLSIAKKVVGVDDNEEALSTLKLDPELQLKFKTAVLDKKNELDELYLEDRKDARKMQEEALNQEDVFSKRFIYYFAIGWSLFAMLYLAGITFFTVPESSTRFSDTILGFLLGTIISGIVQFFYGSSVGSKHKTDKMLK